MTIAGTAPVHLRAIESGHLSGRMIHSGTVFELPAATLEDRHVISTLVESQTAEFAGAAPAWWDRQSVRLRAKKPLWNIPGKMTKPGDIFTMAGDTPAERRCAVQHVNAGNAGLVGDAPAWWADAWKKYGPEFQLHTSPTPTQAQLRAGSTSTLPHELAAARRTSQAMMAGTHPALLGH